MSIRTLRRAGIAGLAAALLLAAPAAADPFFEPDEAPVDSVAELELDLAHGCFAGDDGHSHGDESDEQPTLEVAVEVPGEVEHIEPMELDGWELEVEEDDEGRVEAVTWLAEEGTEEHAPVFELEAVHGGEVGDEVVWPVFQGCEDEEYRWVAAPGDDDGDPAPVVTLVEADPDAPPPEPEDADGDADGDDATEEDVTDDPADGDADDVAGEETDPDAGELDADEAGDDGGLPGWLVLVVLLVVVGFVGAVLARRSRGAGASGGDAAA